MYKKSLDFLPKGFSLKVLKPLCIKKLPKISKLSLGFSLILLLMGYQPTFTIPPVKKSIIEATFSQEQTITSTSLSEPFELPHPGYITTYFSSWHPGVDIATGLGMPVHPVTTGRVVEVTYGLWGLGHSVVVEHEHGFKSTYGHMGKIYAKVNDEVTSKSTLGEVGLTGHTSGPHTHLEITKNDLYIDPLTVLPKIPQFQEYAQSLTDKANTAKIGASGGN